MQLIIRLIGAGAALGALGAAALAVLGFFGEVVPAFDVINHLQILLFGATLLGLVAVSLLLRRSRWLGVVMAAASLGFVASAVVVVPEYLSSLAPRPAAEPGRTVIRMMTHNVFGENFDMERVVAVIREENPDIVAVQEFFPGQRRRLDPLMRGLYPYSTYCAGGKRANIGLYSKLPFTQIEDGECSERLQPGRRTAHILAQFRLQDGGRFSVMTTHLDWPVPIDRQAAQMAEIGAVVGSIEGPLALVGDFNSTPWSYALRNFEHENGLRRQTRHMLTFPALWWYAGAYRQVVQFLALDHVFTRGIEVHELHRSPPTGSDHLPVTFSFSVPDEGSRE